MRPAAGLQTLDVLLSALQARDPSLADHTSQVTRLAVALAELLGVAAEEVERIRLAAQLHDIGKLGVPDSILAKSGSLDEAEWAYIRSHTLIGERIVSAAPALRSVAPLIRASHERWDGTGYPDGLAGEDIPLGSRIVAVADAYDAMRSDRPYCRGLGHAAALAELRREAGAHFDPRVVERFPDAYSALAVGPASLSVPRRAVA